MLRVRWSVLVGLLLVCVLGVSRAHPLDAQEPAIKSIAIDYPYPQIRLSPDGRMVAAFEQGVLHDGEIVPEYLPVLLIDVASAQVLRELTGHTDYANEVSFSSDGSRIMTYHDNGDMFIWDSATGSLINHIVALPGMAVRARFYLDSPLLVLTCVPNSRQLCEWDSESGAITRILRPQFATRSEFDAQFEAGFPATYIALALSSSGDQLVAVTSHGGIDLWDIASGTFTTVKPPGDIARFDITSVAFLPGDEQIIFYDVSTEQVHVWDLATQRESIGIPAGYAGAAYFALAPEGERFAWIGGEREAPILNITALADPDDTQSIALPLPDEISLQPRQLSLVFTPDGSTLIAGGFIQLSNTPVENVIFVVKLE